MHLWLWVIRLFVAYFRASQTWWCHSVTMSCQQWFTRAFVYIYTVIAFYSVRWSCICLSLPWQGRSPQFVWFCFLSADGLRETGSQSCCCLEAPPTFHTRFLHFPELHLLWCCSLFSDVRLVFITIFWSYSGLISCEETARSESLTRSVNDLFLDRLSY